MNENDEIQEQKRVTFITKLLKNEINKAKTALQNAKAETQQVQKNYGTNTSVNYLEADDRIETKADLQQQRSLVNKVVEDENITKHQLTTFQSLKKSPYFGRIDIKDDGDSETDTLYIGTASLIDKDGEFLIHDWRAPISSIYYNGNLGSVSYKTPNGIQKAELLKKRQFQIKNGKIVNLFDTNETVGDELLQSELSSKSPSAMQNIVATIQREQNDIIRDTTHDLLVVQGVAGSGKTSALLQRIAFLLYHSRDNLNADQILLFSPNLLFSNYIKEVLPSLGEHNMRQVTLAKFFSKRFEGVQVQTLFDRFENNEISNHIHELKGSQAFIDNINDYLAKLKPADLVFTDIHFHGATFFSKSEIQNIYTGLNPNLLLADKLLKTKNILIKRLKHRISTEINKEWVAEELNNLSDEQYHDLLGEKTNDDFANFDDERDYIATQIVKKRLQIVYDAIYNNSFWDPYSQYEQFLAQYNLPTDISKADWQKDIKSFEQQLEYHRIRLDDAAPLLYLRDKFTGENKNNLIKYLFIDEVQDYSVAEIMYLKLIFRNANFNLIGDSEQAIFKDVESAETLLTKLNKAIAVKNPHLIKLNRSYRSTYQITKFASSILPAGDKIEAFNRPGEKPTLYQENDDTTMQQRLKAVIKQKIAENETVAIITKNQAEADYVYRAIRSTFDTLLVSDSARSITKKVVVLPVYLAKGLEFDSVIAWNTSAENYSNYHSLGILYTIMTRAMHSLTLLSNGEVTPLISQKAYNEKLIDVKQE